jgi:hypothetical protein
MFVRLRIIPFLALLVPGMGAQEPPAKPEVKVESSRLLPPGWNLKAPRAKPSDPLLNEPRASQIAPEEPTRSATSKVRIQNETGWVIQIRVDGRLLGVVAPNASLEGFCISGDTNLQAYADFTDGSRRAWGPSDTWINGLFVWKLVK